MKIMTKLTILAAACICAAGTAANAAWSGFSYSNACNTEADLPEKGAVLVDSADDRAPDGTAYIKSDTVENALNPKSNTEDTVAAGAVVAQFEMANSDEITGPCIWETDIRFDGNGAGFSPRNGTGANEGKVDTTLLYYNGSLRLSKASAKALCAIDTTAWYHITLDGTYTGSGSTEGSVSLTVQKYQSDGTLETVYENAAIDRRNNYAPTRLVFQSNTSVDNVKVAEKAPAAVQLSADGTTTINAGDSIQFSSTVYTDTDMTEPVTGLDVTYELLDENGEYLITDDILIDKDGLLTTSASAGDGEFVVRVTVDGTDVYDELTITVEGVQMLEFEGFGFDESYATLKELKYIQNYEYEGAMSFVVAVKDENGVLKQVYFKNLSYSEQSMGEFVVNINAAMLEDFDQEKDTITLYTWSQTMK